MALKRLPRKKWYTLESATRFLQENTDENLSVRQEDLLQYAAEGSLTLSIKLFSPSSTENFELLKIASNQRIRMRLRSVIHSSQKRLKDGQLIYENSRVFTPNEEAIPEHILQLGEKEAAGEYLTNSEILAIRSALSRLGPHALQGEPEFYPHSELIEAIGLLVEPVDELEAETVLSRNAIWGLVLNKNSEEIINQIWRHCHNSPSVSRESFSLLKTENVEQPLESQLGETELLFREPTKQYVLRIVPNQLPDKTLLGITSEHLDALLTTPTTASPHDEDYISVALNGMNRAALEFWSTAEKDNSRGQEKNETVAKWLKENYSLSDSLAKSAASLIRPSWASTGRKPNAK
ncbi:hypothetical protein [Marinobacter sp. ELB17]|uniref:hypothetical protein n=1 Tax=Marinobacter sp. ELB17 TaxID=270374 RepID=UPI0000F37EA7|nr:hypothetical protein [Marinobacter sp. ELB17]EBA00266.1 hypothetical protein MELB17_04082 [Marinobacter sp. ELB17]